MTKKILLVLVAAGLAAGLLFFFQDSSSFTRAVSPAAVATFDSAGLSVKVQYCQPAKKGRLIFGREQDRALVPYGKVWRTGANEATLITLDQDTRLGPTLVPAGTYSLWSIPGPGRWQLVVNRETGQWGTQYNDGKDLVRIPIAIRVQPRVRENFTIYFEHNARGPALILSWDQTEAIVPLATPAAKSTES